MKFAHTTIAAALALAFSGAVFAQANTVQRDANQQQRIEQGLQSGSLSTREAAKLEKEETNPDAALEYQQRNLMAFAATEEVPYDSSGRIVFPPMMRRKGQIGELALFLGTGETFQIWNPQLLLAEPRIPEDLKDIARFRLEERGQS